MKKRNLSKRVIALTLATVSVFSVANITATSAYAANTSIISRTLDKEADVSSLKGFSFMDLLETGVSKGIEGSISAALTPILKTMLFKSI